MADVTGLIQKIQTYGVSNPDHLALVWKNGQWSYAELWQEILRLERDWRAIGVKEGEAILWIEPRREQWALGWLVCLKMNLCWCPWVEKMGKVRQQTWLKRWRPEWQGTFEQLERYSGGEHHGSSNVQPPHRGSSYVYLTSGSSGEPKGVVGNTAALTGLWEAQSKAFEHHSHTYACWMLSQAFDASLSDLGCVWWVGGTIYASDPQEWMHFDRAKAFFQKHQFTSIDVPIGWLYRSGLTVEDFPALESIIAGGEVTPEALWERFKNGVHWYNVYGPTEATVCSSLERRVNGAPTLGFPIAELTYGVWEHNALRSPFEGEIFELAIRGEGVAWEYFGQPDLSKERFKVCPQTGLRVFLTRDQVQFSEGRWWFKGRLDRQYKKNGQLANLDELEHVLRRFSVDGVAFKKKDEVVLLIPAGHAVSQIRELLKANLASWSQPDHVQEWSKEWPMLTSGKVDYQRLMQEWGAT